MTTWLTWVQGGVLIGLAIALTMGLVSVVARDHQLPAIDGAGLREPDLRVLLRHTPSNQQHWPQVRIRARRDLVLTRPDNPDMALAIPAQSQLIISPQGEDGLKINHLVPGDNRLISWRCWEVYLQPVVTPDLGNDDRLVQFTLQDEVAERHYLGRLGIYCPVNDRCVLINELPLESYVAGLLQAEMSGSWPIEALKAQAIAGRSYAYSHHLRPRSLPGGGRMIDYHLSDGDDDPSYRGSGPAAVKIDWAVAETRGQILTWQGQPFAAEFHASSGGYTASYSELAEVRPQQSLPLQQVMAARKDPWCLLGAEQLGHVERYWQREVIIPGSELREKLNARWPEQMTVEREHGSQRIRAVKLRLKQGLTISEVVMSGHRFRQLVGLARLRSTRWSSDSPVAPYLGDSGAWRVTTFGYGHGVGLSQVSAFAMANAGQSAYDILDFFYDNAQVHRLW